MVAQSRTNYSYLIGAVLRYAVLGIGLSVTLLPFVYVILSSLKTPSEIIQIPPTLFPKVPTWQNYTTIFNDHKVPLGLFFFNSSFVAIARVAVTLFTSSLAGYIFARYEFGGKGLMFAVIMAQIMIPFQMIMIPLYLILVKLQLIDVGAHHPSHDRRLWDFYDASIHRRYPSRAD